MRPARSSSLAEAAQLPVTPAPQMTSTRADFSRNANHAAEMTPSPGIYSRPRGVRWGRKFAREREKPACEPDLVSARR
jgi:hypothetical protein